LQLSAPGYSGYVPAVASENCFGKTFAMASHASATNQIVRGTDLGAKDKFVTSSGAEYIHHDGNAHANVSQTVGVHRPQDTYQKVSFGSDQFKSHSVTPSSSETARASF
jgi:hypothetical protein